MLKIDMVPIGGVLCIRLSGKLNRQNISKLSKEVILLLKKAKIKNVILNIKDLDYIDSYGKKAIIDSIKTCHFNKGNSFLCLDSKQEEQLKFGKLKYLRIINDELKAINLINL